MAAAEPEVEVAQDGEDLEEDAADDTEDAAWSSCAQVSVSLSVRHKAGQAQVIVNGTSSMPYLLNTTSLELSQRDMTTILSLVYAYHC